MSNPSSWFGIHAHDLDRAKAFYESVFDKPLQDVGGNGFRFIIFPSRLHPTRYGRHDLAR